VKVGVLAALALSWLAVGVHGVFSYGDAYLNYRGFPPPKDPPGVQRGRTVKEYFWSPALRQKRSYLVYEPPGYTAAVARGKRFPVLYLLHGSPGNPRQFVNVARVGVDLDKGVHAHTLRPFLIVMPNGSNGTFMSETEWANTPRGRFESLVMETVHDVDSRFPTLRNRRDRAIGGNSEGAYAAANIGLRHLGLFSIAESWSGYLWEDHSGAFKHVAYADMLANSPEFYIPQLIRRLHHLPFHIYLYQGTHEPSRERAREQQVALELQRAGGHVTYRVFHGGHDWRLWRDQMPRMLAYADHWFGRKR
jgi:enterochelin esterase-like enzyme